MKNWLGVGQNEVTLLAAVEAANWKLILYDIVLAHQKKKLKKEKEALLTRGGVDVSTAA